MKRNCLSSFLISFGQNQANMPVSIPRPQLLATAARNGFASTSARFHSPTTVRVPSAVASSTHSSFRAGLPLPLLDTILKTSSKRLTLRASHCLTAATLPLLLVYAAVKGWAFPLVMTADAGVDTAQRTTACSNSLALGYGSLATAACRHAV